MKIGFLLIIIYLYGFSSVAYVQDTQLNMLIDKMKSNSTSQDEILKLTEYIDRKYIDLDENLEAFGYVIKNVQEIRLSSMPPRVRFYLSGPRGLEIYALLKLKKLGLSNEDIANLLLSAKGRYAKLGINSKSILKEKGFDDRLIAIIDNYEFLLSGGKVKIRDLVVMTNNKVDKDKISDLIMQTQLGDIKYTKENAQLLEQLGMKKEHIYILVYNKLFQSGPSYYNIYDIYVDKNKNKLTDMEIETKIKETLWHYRDYSTIEKEVLAKFGISQKLLTTMDTVTQEFYKKSKNITTDNEDKIKVMTAQKVKNFVNQEDTLLKTAYSNNQIFNGIKKEDKEESTGTKVLKIVGECAAKMLALKACDQAPFPLNYGCTALVENKFSCVD